MAMLTVGKENGHDVQIYFEDRGSGSPVVLVHGWPLNGASWERQSASLLAAGHRVVTFDRRGFGRSTAPCGGYDYETMTTDVARLIDALDLQNAMLVGFSMGGGEVARYMARHNRGRVTRCAFLSSIAPALRKDGNNPEGVDPGVFEELKRGIEKDRFAFLQGFLKNFYNQRALAHAVSDAKLEADFIVASMSSYQAMLMTVDAWLEDFRDDVKRIDAPMLVVHGDKDQIVPLEASGARMPKLAPKARLHVVKDGPHGLLWTHTVEVNKVLLTFMKG
jgi:pimeloyl-ACP methyl ester carboxylesterase